MIINGYNFSKYPIIKVPSFCVKRKASSKKNCFNNNATLY